MRKSVFRLRRRVGLAREAVVRIRVQRNRRAAGKPEAIARLPPERNAGVETNGQ